MLPAQLHTKSMMLQLIRKQEMKLSWHSPLCWKPYWFHGSFITVTPEKMKIFINNLLSKYQQKVFTSMRLESTESNITLRSSPICLSKLLVHHQQVCVHRSMLFFTFYWMHTTKQTQKNDRIKKAVERSKNICPLREDVIAFFNKILVCQWLKISFR